MTSHNFSDETIRSDDRFNELLTELLVAAHEGGVEVEGAWECMNEVEEHDWDVSVVQFVSQDRVADE
jgi:hypothetical protein